MESGKNSDDVYFHDLGSFEGRAVVTEKMDGECTTVYHDGYCHARSTASGHHPSRTWMKMFAATLARDIPDGWRICGENLYAYHSVFYTEITSYFMVYWVYDERNACLPWDQTESLGDVGPSDSASSLQRPVGHNPPQAVDGAGDPRPDFLGLCQKNRRALDEAETGAEFAAGNLTFKLPALKVSETGNNTNFQRGKQC